jgi:hypothetical protein
MKKILVISLVLALALTLILPSAVMAAPDKTVFSATGVFSSIDEGNVKPLGNTGRYLVADRHLSGSFINDTLTGNFTITYGGIFNIADQSGKLIGTLETANNKLCVIGETQPLQYVGYPGPDSDGSIVIPCLMIVKGNWTGLKGLAAKGTFEAQLVLNVYADPAQPTFGHVKSVVEGQNILTMTGQYNRNR